MENIIKFFGSSITRKLLTYGLQNHSPLNKAEKGGRIGGSRVCVRKGKKLVTKTKINNQTDLSAYLEMSRYYLHLQPSETRYLKWIDGQK